MRDHDVWRRVFSREHLAEQNAYLLLSIERQKQIIESFRQGGMGDHAVS
jgi:hypothetical protein